MSPGLRLVSTLVAAGLALPGAGCTGGFWDRDRSGGLTALTNPDPVVRAQGIQKVGHLADPEDLTALTLRTGDPDALVRASLAEALGHFDDRRASEGLAELLRDPAEEVELQAATALGKQSNPAARAILVRAYQRSGSLVRARVAGELEARDGGALAEAIAAEAAGLYALYSRDLGGSGAERLTAAEQLGRSGRPEAVERLTSYLGAESHLLAAAAARGLGGSGSAAARAPLEALLTEEDPQLRIAGAQALAELGDPQAVPALLQSLEEGGTSAQAALSALRTLGRADSNARIALCEAALGEEAELAAQAGRWAHREGLACPTTPYLARLRSGGPTVGAALAGLAETYRPSPAAERTRSDAENPGPPLPLARPLSDLLRRGPPAVRPWAARALGALRVESAEPDLRRALKEAEGQLARARERWVKEPAPGRTAETTGSQTQLGTSGGPSPELLGMLARSGIDLAPEDPARQPSLFSPDPPEALELWSEAALALIRLWSNGRQPEGEPDSVDGAGGSDSAPALLGRLRGDPAARARLAAVEAIQTLEPAERWPALLPLLTDRDAQVRAAALDTAGDLDPSVGAAGPWLLAQLATLASQPDVPIAPLVEALSKRPELPGLVPALAAALDFPGAAPHVAEALGRLGRVPALRSAAGGAVLAQLDQPQGAGLAELLTALGTFATPDGLPPGAPAPRALQDCRRLLFHVDPEVRAAAVQALLALGAPSGVAEVQPLSFDYDQRVRRAVAREPGRGPPQATDGGR